MVEEVGRLHAPIVVLFATVHNARKRRLDILK
jgi:hypothetical protein